MQAPDLDLDVRPHPPPRPPKPRAKAEEPQALELAVDPRDLVQQRAAASSSPSWPAVQAMPTGALSRRPSVGFATPERPPSGPGNRAAPTPVDDVDYDAHVLADLGQSPSNVLRTPMYAWRVLKRQRELRTALEARRAEAEHAVTQVDDALVAFTERVRPAAEKRQDYAASLEDLQRAEDMLRSRDKVLAAEQDAQKARQAQVDERLAKLEADLLAARDEERMAATDLSGAQSALAREEAKLKRAEGELKTAQQVEQRGTGGAGT